MISKYSYNYVTRKLAFILGKIIDSNVENFRANKSFKVWTDYSYSKFYLDKIDRDHDMSLEGLIHHILYAEGLYFKYLPRYEYKSVKEVALEHSKYTYCPFTEKKRKEEMIDLIIQINANITDFGIAYVGNKLKLLGFKRLGHFDEYLDFDKKYFLNYLKNCTILKRKVRMKIRDKRRNLA